MRPGILAARGDFVICGRELLLTLLRDLPLFHILSSDTEFYARAVGLLERN